MHQIIGVSIETMQFNNCFRKAGVQIPNSPPSPPQTVNRLLMLSVNELTRMDDTCLFVAVLQPVTDPCMEIRTWALVQMCCAPPFNDSALMLESLQLLISPIGFLLWFYCVMLCINVDFHLYYCLFLFCKPL